MSDTELETSNTTGCEPLESSIESVENTNTETDSSEVIETVNETGVSEEKISEKEPVDKSETVIADNDAIKTLQNDVAGLSEQIKCLGKLFESKILHTAHEEKIVDQMHKELQRYKEDIYSQLVRPILLDIIAIRDSIQRVSSAHRSKPEDEQHVPLKTFETYAFEVQEILENNNIEIYKSEINTDFVPVRQRAIKKVAATDECMHGKIAESLSDGYAYMGKTITPEKIAVYFYEPQQIQTESIKKEEN